MAAQFIWCCTATIRSPRRSGSMTRARTTSGILKSRITADAHVRRMHEFVDSLTAGRLSRYTGRDGLRDLRVAIGSICSAREGNPIEVREVTDSLFFGGLGH